MSKNNSSSRNNYYSLGRRVARMAAFSVSSSILTIAFLWSVFSLLGNKTDFYIEGRKFDLVKQEIDNGSLELISNEPTSWKITNDGIEFSIQFPQYASIDNKYIYNNEEVESDNIEKITSDKDIYLLTIKISSDDGHLCAGACTYSGQWKLVDAQDWRIQTKIKEQSMVCTYSRIEDDITPDVEIQFNDPNNTYLCNSTIQTSQNVYTILSKGKTDKASKFKCEIWINKSSQDGKPNRTLDNIDYIFVKSDYPIKVAGKTSEIKLDDDLISESPVNNLFDDKNFYEINMTNVNQVNILSFDGDIYQYVGEDLTSYKSLRENINSKGTFNSIWSLKNGESNLEINGIPTSVTKNNTEIKQEFATWLKCNATSITLTIIAGVVGGLLEFFKSGKYEEE